MPDAVPGADLRHDQQRAAVLAAALAATAAELRLLDPDDLIGYVRRARWAEIADLVETASELHLAAGCLSFSCCAGYALDWVRAPTIALDLEFSGEGVSAFFTLHLGRAADRIELREVFFNAEPADEAAGTALLAAAVAAARLPGCAGPA